MAKSKIEPDENLTPAAGEAEQAEKLTITADEFEKLIEKVKKEARDEAEKVIAENKAPVVTEEAKKPPQNDYLNELVEVRLFRDNGKYKEDVTLQLNGETCRIKRGVAVKIKRKFALVLEQSLAQDDYAAAYIAQLAEESERKLKHL